MPKKRKRTKTITYDSSNVTRNAARLYQGKKIKKKKVVTTTTPRKTKVRTVEYGPMTTYGRQKKKRSKTVVRH